MPLTAVDAEPRARIGPNALIQTAAALVDRAGHAVARGILASSGELALLDGSPDGMVDEARFTRIVGTLVTALGAEEADLLLRDAGERTGRYLLRHRIPRAMPPLLRTLPAPLAFRILLRAIGQHSWTFAGSGQFTCAIARDGITLSFGACPVCRGLRAEQPVCGFYAGTFETLFRALIHPAYRVRETACTALGAERCVLRAERSTSPHRRATS